MAGGGLLWLLTALLLMFVVEISCTLTSDAIRGGLRPRLSANASIIFPGDALFANATRRWQTFKAPSFSFVVMCATEKDVQEAVIYGNENNIPWLPYSGGHGTHAALGNVKNGMEINLRLLNQVIIASDGQTAQIGGGSKVLEVSSALFAAGKQTVTGVCECIGMIAPGLGGGYGILHGKHGLISDQWVEARAVLADGSLVEVSKSSYSDLFFGLGGAGHNLAIITQVTSKIYDVDGTWSFDMFIFTQDKLEAVYDVINKILPQQVPGMFVYSIIALQPTIDPVNPVILLFVLVEGTPAQVLGFTSPLHKLSPASVSNGTVPYSGIPKVLGAAADDASCQDGFTAMRMPLNLQSYNTAALRKAFNLFNSTMAAHPGLATSFMVMEQYSVQGALAVPADQSAFPARNAKVLATAIPFYAPNATLNPIAENMGEEIRDILLASSGEKLNAYVNYAHGDESVPQVYGFEEQRLRRLYVAKHKYDPFNRFRFYAPLGQECPL